MSRLMMILGIVLAVLGLGLVVLSIVSPGKMQVYGVTLEVGALLLVGGIVALGLAGVISALERNSAEVAMPIALSGAKPVESKAQSATGFVRKGPEAAAAAATATLAAATQPANLPSKSTMPSVADTISALEQAKSDIKTALGGMDVIHHPADEAAPVPLAAQHAAAEHGVEAEGTSAEEGEGDLYIVEEKIIRGRPARVLSDDTVEAETDEGWMRFENLEHLNEYLDSVEEGQV